MPADQLSSRPSAQDQINGQLYQRPDLVRFYTTTNLYPPEAVALVRYREDVYQRCVLDLGCGAGRLAVYLRPLTDHYVGVDSSPHMVAHCRQTFPELEFLQADMRSLPYFGAGSFHTVFGVFNLFDAVSHADRLRTLTEVRRLLVPEGLLVFSSHNRNYAEATAGPRLRFHRNPLTQARCVMEFVQAWANRRRLKSAQRFEPDYALLNDSAHNYSVLHYYISRDAQVRQLAAAGFRLIECLDELGRTLDILDDDRAYSSIHYVARPTV
jgi:SAM-dependent methyltransferase